MFEILGSIAFLLALYLVECLVWLRHDTFAAVPTVFGNFQLKRPSRWLGSSRRGIILLNPFAPIGHYQIPDPAVIISPNGILAVGEDSHTLVHLPLDDVEGSGTDRAQRLQQHLRVVLEQGGWWEAIIADHGFLSSGSADDRRTKIKAKFAAMFDTAAIRKQTEQDEGRLAILSSLATIQLILLLIVLPSTLIFESASFDAVVVALTIVAVQVIIGVLYWFARRDLISEPWGWRTLHALGKIAYPPAGLRSADTLVQEKLAAIHPLAVAAALLTSRRFAAFAREYRRRQPYRPGGMPPAPDQDLADIKSAWAQLIDEQISDICAGRQISLEATRDPIPQSSESARSYCPNCRATYILESGFCADCLNVGLVALPTTESSTPTKNNSGRPKGPAAE